MYVKQHIRPFMACFILLTFALFFSSVRGSAHSSAPTVPLPVGADTFKIAVDHDGIYGISGSELQAAGLNLSGVDPDEMRVMHRGKSVSYRFVNNDGSAGFGLSDEIQFYGWAFDGLFLPGLLATK